jgi:hypothetical protein
MKDERLYQQSLDIKKLLEDSQRILSNSEEMKDVLDDTREELFETRETLDETNDTLQLVAKKLDISVTDRSVKPRLRSKVEQFVLMFIEDNKYYVTRGKRSALLCNAQKSYTDSVRMRKENNGYRHILTITCTPNARYLLQSIVDCITITRSLNTLNINTITEDDLISKINTIYEERKNITI